MPPPSLPGSVLVVLSAACSFDPAGGPDPTGDGGQPARVDAASTGDGGGALADAAPPCPNSPLPFTPTSFDPCALPAPLGSFTVDDRLELDTDAGTARYDGVLIDLATVELTQPLGPPIQAWVVVDLTVGVAGEIVVRGPQPGLIVALGTLVVAGRVDASARALQPGPGGQDCPGTAGSGRGLGGGGGAFGDAPIGAISGQVAGRGGGTAQSDGGPAGVPATAQEPTPLRGGCGGGLAVGGGGPGGRAGGAGGGLQLVAGDQLVVSGEIVSNGGGGEGGVGRGASTLGGGGGGGGAGGLLVLEAPAITISGRVRASGGGGGEGGDSNQGDPGVTARSNELAPGGTGGGGGDGGAGSVGASAGTDGGPSADGDGGGGGGGGAGMTWFIAPPGRLTLSGADVPSPRTRPLRL